MSFDWRQYLNVARELMEIATRPSNQEARLRAGISRAYYAAFNQARNYLASVYYIRWNPDDRNGSHQFVIDQFRQHPDPIFKEIGAHLHRMRVQRVKADYREKFIDLRDEARRQIHAAEYILELLDTLPQ